MELQNNYSKSKNYTISLLRFFAMLFIVIYHSLQYYGIESGMWLDVGVPIFFCISGFLYGNKKITSPINFILKNFKKILIPYYCFLIPTIILYFIFHRDYLSIKNVAGAFLTSGTIEGIGHLWFISYILFCYLITPLLQELADKMKKLKWYMFLLVFFAITISLELITRSFDFYFVFLRWFSYLFGYFAAVFIQNYKYNIFKTLICILSCLAVLMNIVRFYGKYILHIDSKLFGFYLEYSHALLGISTVFMIMIIFKNINVNPFLNLSDKYSFYIYLVHQLFIMRPFTLLSLTDYTIINILLCISAIVLSSVILKYISELTEKLLSRLTQLTKIKFTNKLAS